FDRRENGGRILAAQHHDPRCFLLRFFHHGDGKAAEADGHYGNQQQGHHDGGDERAPVAQRIHELFAVDDADVAQAHAGTPPVPVTTPTKMSSRSRMPCRARRSSSVPSASSRPPWMMP